jgi:ribonucleoside-triphosphate reductase (thioredoxin)
MDSYQEYIHKSRYARYIPEEQRRENWDETARRYCDYFKDRGQLTGKDYDEVFNAILNLEVMPSMRALMTAGAALDRDNVAGFNCSYMPIDHPRAFDEMMYILMCGTGVGFSVERQYIFKLPVVSEDFHATETTITVIDKEEPQRGLANNSACYTEKPDFQAFLSEWVSLYESKSGERGIFSRVASQKQAAKNGRRDSDWDFGTNPCSEIILRPNQFCNLSEVVVRPDDTFDTLRRKVRIASILGTLQATLTDFRYLRKKWKENTEEEALLGVSMTGILDHPVLSGKVTTGTFFDHPNQPDLAKTLETLKNDAVETNKKWAAKLGINQSAAITCVKPSGTVSQLVDSASGIHGRFASYYIRRVRADSRDPLCGVLEAAGVPVETDITSPTTKIFSFVKKAPANAVMASDQTGLEQLELWTMYQEHWCEHKPSITVYYRDSEFLSIGNWLYNNFDDVSGVSFLPYSNHSYKQAPYEEITKEKYEELVKQMPEFVDWNINEATDVTEGSQELACVGNSCEL